MADEPQDQDVSESAESADQQTEVVADTSETLTPAETQEETHVEEPPVEKVAEKTAPEAAPEPVAEKPKAPAKPVSASLEKIIKQIEELSVLELADLVHALEDRFGVSASAPVAVAAGVGVATGEPAEEKTTFNVILSSAG